MRQRHIKMYGCKFLTFKYVEHAFNEEMDRWVIDCSQGDKCTHYRRMGGASKSCFADCRTIEVRENNE